VRVLLINVHSLKNAGDAVLNRVAVAQLRDVFPGCQVTMAMTDPEGRVDADSMVGSFTHWARRQGRGWRPLALLGLLWESLVAAGSNRLFGKAWLRRNASWYSLLAAYYQADIVVSSPGNFIYSSGTIGLPFMLALYAMAYGRLANRPLYLLPQTIGPLTRARDRRLLRWVLSSARLILVRDELSLVELNRAGVKDPIRLVPDVAFALSSASRDQGMALLAAHGLAEEHCRPLLGVTLINWGAQNRLFDGQEQYEEAVAQGIERFVRRYGGCAVLFGQVRGPTAADDDLIPARRVLDRLDSLPDRVFLIDGPVAAEELKSAYGLMDLFLGSRLHSNIFALTEGVPAVAVQYQFKTTGIFRLLGLQRWVLPIEQCQGGTLADLVEKAWLARAETRSAIQATMPAIVSQARSAGQLIAADYARLRSAP
jgi:colanic acid/amylovoran biosynthesis protein